MSSKTVIALLIALGIVVWLFSGQFGEATSHSETPLTNDGPVQVAAVDAKPYLVRTMASQAQSRLAELPVRGVTKANRIVNVRAEVSGKLIRLPAVRGTRVKEGDELCALAADSRPADLTQARALFNKASLEYKGILNLSKEGLQSEINIAQAKAELETASANVKRAELALEKTIIRAPFAGIIVEQPVEIGHVLSPGAACVSLMESDPILVAGEIAEKNIRHVKPGDTVRAQLVHGPAVSGSISFIASTPDSATRTYLVEVTVPNPGDAIRAGLSVEMYIPLEQRLAHLISSAALVLNDAGEIGVRVVDRDNIVRFHKVELLSEQDGRVWAAGLPDVIRLITVGQEIVFAGQTVRVDPNPLSLSVSN